jgi:hypothetical protein
MRTLSARAGWPALLPHKSTPDTAAIADRLPPTARGKLLRPSTPCEIHAAQRGGKG